MKERKNNDTQHKEFPTVDMPHYDTPVGDPPVPNRAHTEMRLQNSIDVLSEPEKASIFTNQTE